MVRLSYKEIYRHYLKEEVIEEILRYSRNRWLALEGKFKERVFYRYWEDGKPLSIKNKEEYYKLLKEFKYKFRTIYASINLYKSLENKESLKDLKNIYLTTPVFDIDGSIEEINLIKEAANIILEKLKEYKVEESIYLIWSGRGIHIHLNEKAFSQEILEKYHSLDLAYSIVEFIIKKSYKDLVKIYEKSKSKDRKLKVENKIDIQRVFTVPLSLHRELDYVCVAFKPEELESFDLSWVNIKSYKHNKNWNTFKEGELDYLAKIAIKEVGGYTKEYLKERKIRVEIKPIKKEKLNLRGRIGRFQVMALLQAARYYIIKEKNIDKAKSFGLNRAIFYAWAKYYKPIYGVSKRRLIGETIKKELGLEEENYKFIEVGNEKAPISNRGWFIIGNKEQLPEDFDKQVKEKIENYIPFELAWKVALEYLSKFPKRILEDQQEFYEKVYKPVRDRFLELVKNYLRKNK